MAHPLELSYNWRTPAVLATIGAFICLGVLARGRANGWVGASLVVLLLWAVLVGVLFLRTRAYLMVDGDALTVRGEDGATRRVIAPVALLRGGHSTLFAWILAEAPHAELDNRSQRTAERLQSKGLLP